KRDDLQAAPAASTCGHRHRRRRTAAMEEVQVAASTHSTTAPATAVHRFLVLPAPARGWTDVATVNPDKAGTAELRHRPRMPTVEVPPAGRRARYIRTNSSPSTVIFHSPPSWCGGLLTTNVVST